MMPKSSEIEGLTKAQRRALEWLRDNGPTSVFPVGVNMRLLRKMVEPRLVEESTQVERGFPLPVVVLSITDAGRAALKPEPVNDGQ